MGVRGPMKRNEFRDHVRQLRINQTDAERQLWTMLRSRRFAGFKFRRQQPIDHYIADFCCLEKRLIIELDGGQHASQQSYDDQRTRYLNENGFRVLRFWNNQLMAERNAVMEMIFNALSPHPPRGRLLPQGEKDKGE